MLKFEEVGTALVVLADACTNKSPRMVEQPLINVFTEVLNRINATPTELTEATYRWLENHASFPAPSELKEICIMQRQERSTHRALPTPEPPAVIDREQQQRNLAEVRRLASKFRMPGSPLRLSDVNPKHELERTR